MSKVSLSLLRTLELRKRHEAVCEILDRIARIDWHLEDRERIALAEELGQLGACLFDLAADLVDQQTIEDARKRR